MESKKAASFLIKDLLTATQENGVFVQKNNKFKQVCLCGTITRVLSRDKLTYTVDDGSATIDCYLNMNRSPLVKQNEADLKTLKQSDLKNHLNKGALLLAVATEKIVEKHLGEALAPGDRVRIVGKLRKYPERSCVFIDRIEKVSVRFHTEYLRDLFYLYDHVYDK